MTEPTPDSTTHATATADVVETALPESVVVEDWVASICDIEQGLLDTVDEIRGAVDVTSLSFEQRRENEAREHPLRMAAFEGTRERLRELAAPEGAESFQDALIAEMDVVIAAQHESAEAIAAAESLAEIEEAGAQYAAASGEANRNRLMAVGELPDEVRAALAAYESGCRFLNLEARGVPEAAESPIDWTVAYETDFEADQLWDITEANPAEGVPAINYVDGRYRWEFAAAGGYTVYSLDILDVETHLDVRLEADVAVDGTNTEAGLTCRDTAEQWYEAVITVGGTVRIQRSSAAEPVFLAQRTSDAVRPGDANRLTLECYGDGGADGPVTLAVSANGERLIEIVDDDALAAPGYVGMAAGTNGPGVATFDNLVISTP